MAKCRGVLQPTADDIRAGLVLHNADCTREWLVLSNEPTQIWGRDGVYPSLFFDKDHLGEGVNAVLFGQDVITLHISTQGLLAKRGLGR
jgi:hypothetical protein